MDSIDQKPAKLDVAFFDAHRNLTKRQISELVGVSLDSVKYQYKLAYGKKLSRGRTDFTSEAPSVDQKLLYNRDWLYSKYIIDMVGTTTIAKLLGTKASVVIKQLKVFDIKLRSTAELVNRRRSVGNGGVRIIEEFILSSKLVRSINRGMPEVRFIENGVVASVSAELMAVWSDGLTTLIFDGSKLSAAGKLAVEKYCNDHKYYQIIIDYSKLDGILNGYCSTVEWSGSVYRVPRSYLTDHRLVVEVMFHEIISRVCPWRAASYGDGDLVREVERLRRENIDLYSTGGQLKLSTFNSAGTPGNRLITHFQPHFWDVCRRGGLPISRAFYDPHIIYRCLNISCSENESLSFERLVREVNFHYPMYSKTSHFAAGFVRAVIQRFGMSGKRVFDPCCGWGGRLIGSWLEGCQYSGCDVSPGTCAGLNMIREYIGFSDCLVMNQSCIECAWPDADFVFTSPPFYDIEEYIGGIQPWTIGSRERWVESFVRPFVDRIKCLTALYLDERTKDDFERVRKFSSIIKVGNQRHTRLKPGFELLCVYGG